MIKLKRIAFSRLLKLEIPALLNTIAEIVGRHNPSALRLEDLHVILLGQKVKAQEISSRNKGHWLTTQLNQLHTKRVKYAALITTQLVSLKKADIDEINARIETVKFSVRTYLTYLGQMRLGEVHTNIEAFFHYLSTEPTVQEAFVGLGMQPFLEEMEKANNEHYRLYMQKEREMDERLKDDYLLVEHETKRILQLFLDQLESYQHVFKDIDYNALVSEINVVMGQYSKLINTRIAVNKRKAKKRKKDKTDSEEI